MPNLNSLRYYKNHKGDPFFSKTKDKITLKVMGKNWCHHESNVELPIGSENVDNDYDIEIF